MMLKRKIFFATVASVLISLLQVTSAYALTGTCSMLVTSPVPFGVNTSDDTVPAFNSLTVKTPVPFQSDYNSLAVVNLTNNTISMHMVFVQYGSAAPKQRPFVVGTASYTNVPFKIAAGTLPGSQVVTGTLPATTVGGAPLAAIPFSMNMVPVNGGQTLLIQGNNTPFSGVCQF